MNKEELFKKKYRSKIASTRGRVDKNGKPIEMKLSLAEFIKLYEDAGVLPIHPYVLSRVSDLGDYEVGNVFISTNNKNSLDAHDLNTEENALIVSYCLRHKYKIKVVRNALKSGRLTFEELIAGNRITRYK